MQTSLLTKPDIISSEIVEIWTNVIKQPILVIERDFDTIQSSIAYIIARILEEVGIEETKVIIATSDQHRAQKIDEYLTYAIDLPECAFGLIQTNKGASQRNKVYQNAQIITGPVYWITKDIKAGLCPKNADLAIFVDVESLGKRLPYDVLLNHLYPKLHIAFASVSFSSKDKLRNVQNKLRITKLIETEEETPSQFIEPIFVPLPHQYVMVLRWLRLAREDFCQIINNDTYLLNPYKMTVKKLLNLRNTLEQVNATNGHLNSVTSILKLLKIENDLENKSSSLVLRQFQEWKKNTDNSVFHRLLVNSQVKKVETKLTQISRVHPKMQMLAKIIDEERLQNKKIGIIVSHKALITELVVLLSVGRFGLPADIAIDTLGGMEDELINYDVLIIYDLSPNPTKTLRKLQNLPNNPRIAHIISKNSREEALHWKYFSSLKES